MNPADQAERIFQDGLAQIQSDHLRGALESFERAAELLRAERRSAGASWPHSFVEVLAVGRIRDLYLKLQVNPELVAPLVDAEVRLWADVLALPEWDEGMDNGVMLAYIAALRPLYRTALDQRSSDALADCETNARHLLQLLDAGASVMAADPVVWEQRFELRSLVAEIDHWNGDDPSSVAELMSLWEDIEDHGYPGPEDRSSARLMAEADMHGRIVTRAAAIGTSRAVLVPHQRRRVELLQEAFEASVLEDDYEGSVWILWAMTSEADTAQSAGQAAQSQELLDEVRLRLDELLSAGSVSARLVAADMDAALARIASR